MSTCEHEWQLRGGGDDPWRECWLCGVYENLPECPIECGCPQTCHAAHTPMIDRPHTPRTCPALSTE